MNVPPSANLQNTDPPQPTRPPNPAEELAKISALLETNTALLKKLVDYKQEERKIGQIKFIYYLITNVLPFLLAIGFSYYLYSVTTGQIDALKSFMSGLVPNLDGIQNLNPFK